MQEAQQMQAAMEGAEPTVAIEDEGLPPDAQVVDMRDPKVRAAIKEAKKRVHAAQEEILQQLSVAMKDAEFRDHLRELHPNFEQEIHRKHEPPQRTGNSTFTKKKIDAPANRKKNKAARKARKKGNK